MDPDDQIKLKEAIDLGLTLEPGALVQNMTDASTGTLLEVSVGINTAKVLCGGDAVYWNTRECLIFFKNHTSKINMNEEINQNLFKRST